jgi:hypothetical protein
MQGIRAAFLTVLLAALAAPAAAVTTDQVVALKKAGVSDAVIIALIERDRTVFTLAPEQIVALQREGLSEDLIIAMLRSGQEADEAVRADSANASAAIAAAITPGPDILIVGHGPTRPDTYHYDGFFTNANNPYLFPLYEGAFLPYGAPYQGYVPGAVPLISPRFAPRENRLRQSRSLCYAQMSTSASGPNALGYVTECPQVLQPRRRLR